MTEELKSIKRHRNLSPRFDRKIEHPLVRLIASRARHHDWSANKHNLRIREEGFSLRAGKNRIISIPPRRASVRAERSETLTELVIALAYCCNFNPNSNPEHLLKVRASAQYLATLINQCHHYEKDYNQSGVYRHGRVSYDPVLKAIQDLEAMKAIIVERKYNPERKRYHSLAIYLTPIFFQMLGISRAELQQHFSKLKSWSEKNGELATEQSRKEAYIRKKYRALDIAQEPTKKLKQYLSDVKRTLVGEDSEEASRLKDEIDRRKAEYVSTPEHNEINRLKLKLPIYEVWDIEKALLAEGHRPGTPEYEAALQHRLRERVSSLTQKTIQ